MAILSTNADKPVLITEQEKQVLIRALTEYRLLLNEPQPITLPGGVNHYPPQPGAIRLVADIVEDLLIRIDPEAAYALTKLEPVAVISPPPLGPVQRVIEPQPAEPVRIDAPPAEERLVDRDEIETNSRAGRDTNTLTSPVEGPGLPPDFQRRTRRRHPFDD